MNLGVTGIDVGGLYSPHQHDALTTEHDVEIEKMKYFLKGQNSFVRTIQRFVENMYKNSVYADKFCLCMYKNFVQINYAVS